MIAAGKPEELFVAPNKDVQEFVGDSVEFLPKDGHATRTLKDGMKISMDCARGVVQAMSE